MWNPISRFRSTDTSDDERPPKPEPHDERGEIEKTRYEATIEYRNGDTETFECYGIYSKDGDRVTFNTGPYAKRSWNGGVTYSFNRRSIHYETLAREPVLDEIATDTFVLTWTVDYEWKRSSSHSFASNEWCETEQDAELTVLKDE